MPPRKRRTRNSKNGQSHNKKRASEPLERQESPARSHYRPCRTPEISTEFFTKLFSSCCSPKLNLHFDNRNVLLWSRALSHYKSSLLQSTVEIFLNCHSDETIVRVTFRKPDGQDGDSETYVFECDVDSVMAPVPGGENPLEWSDFVPLMPEKDKRNHEMIIKAVLDSTLFERTVAWVETEAPDITGSDTLEEVHSLSWPEYSKLTEQVLLSERISAEAKNEILLKLLQAGDAAYQTRAVMNIQEAFEDGMKDSSGIDGVRTLLEHLCNIVDCDRLRVKCHGSSHDEYGVQLHIIPYGKGGVDSHMGRGEGDIDDECIDTDDANHSVTPTTSQRNSRSSGSAMSCASSKKSFDEGPHNSSDLADMTVFFRKESRAIPLLVVEIKSHNTENLFKMQKHLLGGLQFSDEIFGLSINPLSARIYRMKKDNSSKKIQYTYKVYGFRSPQHLSDKIVWKSDSFLLMCDHLCKILKYGLNKNERIL